MQKQAWKQALGGGGRQEGHGDPESWALSVPVSGWDRRPGQGRGWGSEPWHGRTCARVAADELGELLEGMCFLPEARGAENDAAYRKRWFD